jgi:O-antigen/teichoic acid export membrane protein
MISILTTTLAGWLARLLAIAVNIVGTPVVLHALGPTRFGIMLISLSIGSWIGLGNAGFGRVVAIITARYDHKSPAFVASVVSHITRLSAKVYPALFVACSTLLLLLVPHIDLGPGASYAAEFSASTIAVFFAMTLWFFLAVFEGVDAGHHELFRLYCFQVLSYSITLILLFTAFKASPSLLFATLLLSSGFLLGNVLQAINVYRRHRTLFTSRRRTMPTLSRAVVVHSLDFTVISIALSVIFQFTTAIAGLVVGPDEIINLGVFMRVIAALAGIILTVAVPMTNLIAGKLARQDRAGALKVAVATSSLVTASVAVAAVVFYGFGERLMQLWLHTPVVYDPVFRIAAALLIFLVAVYACSSGVAIGFDRRRQVARVHAVMAVAILPLSYVGFRTFGQAGILLAIDLVMILGSAGFLLLPGAIVTNRLRLDGFYRRLAVAVTATRRKIGRPPAI